MLDDRDRLAGIAARARRLDPLLRKGDRLLGRRLERRLAVGGDSTVH